MVTQPPTGNGCSTTPKTPASEPPPNFLRENGDAFQNLLQYVIGGLRLDGAEYENAQIRLNQVEDCFRQPEPFRQPRRQPVGCGQV